jgi:uncharacterized protein YjiS (DUF1127 family)
MITSENLSAPIWAQNLTKQFWMRRLMAALQRLWAAYLNWRAEQQAITRLWSMTDAQLDDIGLLRSQIEFGFRADMGSQQLRTIKPF